MERQQRIDLLRAKIAVRRLQLRSLESQLRQLLANGNDATLQELSERRRRALEQHRVEWDRFNGPSWRRNLSAEDEID